MGEELIELQMTLPTYSMFFIRHFASLARYTRGVNIPYRPIFDWALGSTWVKYHSKLNKKLCFTS